MILIKIDMFMIITLYVSAFIVFKLKLEAVGCRSESGFCLYPYEAQGLWSSRNSAELKLDRTIQYGQIAFIYQDFIGPSDQAKKNCEILILNKAKGIENITIVDMRMQLKIFRHNLTDLSESDFWKFISEVVQSKAKEEDALDKGEK